MSEDVLKTGHHVVQASDHIAKYKGKLFEASDFAELIDSAFYINFTKETKETFNELEQLLNDVPKMIDNLILKAKKEIMPKTVHMISDNPEYNFGHGEDYPRLICVRQDEFLQMLNGFKKWFGAAERDELK